MRDLFIHLIDGVPTAAMIAYHIQIKIDLGALALGDAEAVLRYLIQRRFTGNRLVELWTVRYEKSILKMTADLRARALRDAKPRPFVIGGGG